MAYTAKFTISAAPGITANLYVAVYYATSPNAEVAHQLINPPHVASVQVAIPNLDPVALLIKIFETTGTVAGGTVRANFMLDPESGGVELRLDKFYHAGVDPELPVGGNTLTDATLEGWNFTFELAGAGTQEPGDHYTYDDSIGQIILINPAGYQTQQGELWVLHFVPKVVSTTPSSSNAGTFSTLQVINDDKTLTNTDAGSGFLIVGNPAVVNITLPALSLVASYKPWPFFSYPGLHIAVVLKAVGTDQILAYGGTVRTDNGSFILGQYENVTLIPTTLGWLAQPQGADGRDVGEIVYRYDTLNNNVIFASGQLISRTTYIRLWNYVQRLDPSLLITDAQWNNAALNNTAKYSTGDGSTTFRVPRLWTKGILRAVPGSTRKAGSYEKGVVGEFTLNAYKLQKGGLDNHVYTLENIDDPAFPLVPRTYNTGIETLSTNTGVYALIRV
jgi:hypothetical protein